MVLIFNIDYDIIKNILIDALLSNRVNNIVDFLLFLFDNNNNIINF